MKQHKLYLGIAILILLLIGTILYSFKENSTLNSQIQSATTTEINSITQQKPTTPTTPNDAEKVTPPSIKKDFNTYTNVEYKFTIQYPSYVQQRGSFSTFHEIGNNWRLYPEQVNQGKGTVELSVFTIDQGSISNGKQKYPLYFTAVVRVGVSPNIKECYKMDAGYTSQKVTDVTINGILFKKFSSSNGGMMKYVQAESYRTIHNNQCFALEQIKTGSSYRDESMAPGIADSALDNYYATGETIIKTFRFTK